MGEYKDLKKANQPNITFVLFLYKSMKYVDFDRWEGEKTSLIINSE